MRTQPEAPRLRKPLNLTFLPDSTVHSSINRLTVSATDVSYPPLAQPPPALTLSQTSAVREARNYDTSRLRISAGGPVRTTRYQYIVLSRFVESNAIPIRKFE